MTIMEVSMQLEIAHAVSSNLECAAGVYKVTMTAVLLAALQAASLAFISLAVSHLSIRFHLDIDLHNCPSSNFLLVLLQCTHLNCSRLHMASQQSHHLHHLTLQRVPKICLTGCLTGCFASCLLWVCSTWFARYCCHSCRVCSTKQANSCSILSFVRTGKKWRGDVTSLGGML